MPSRKPYPSDVSDEEWAVVVPYVTLLPLDAGPRDHDLREGFNALRWIVRTGAQWRLIPNDFPPWAARFRRLARDYERLPETVAGVHVIAFACLMRHRVVPAPGSGS